MTSDAWALQLNAVRFVYPDPRLSEGLVVLDDLTMAISRNAIVAIVGPSGCGKTTLLNLVAGLLKPACGEIRFDGVREHADAMIGYVFQDPLLLPWRTVLGNVVLGAEIRRSDHRRATAEARRLLQSYGLHGFEHAYPSSLSGGMQQRVAILRAILSGADVLLLDEPFSNTDFFLRRELQRDLITLVTQRQLTALLVTHDINEAVMLGDRVVVLSDRPAHVVAEIDVTVPRVDRLFDRPGIVSELIPYRDKVWEAMRPSTWHE